MPQHSTGAYGHFQVTVVKRTPSDDDRFVLVLKHNKKFSTTGIIYPVFMDFLRFIRSNLTSQKDDRVSDTLGGGYVFVKEAWRFILQHPTHGNILVCKRTEFESIVRAFGLSLSITSNWIFSALDFKRL